MSLFLKGKCHDYALLCLYLPFTIYNGFFFVQLSFFVQLRYCILKASQIAVDENEMCFSFFLIN